MTRWFLWTFRCWRGRRCADLVPEGAHSDLPSGSVMHLNYICAGCGTKYNAIFRWDGRSFQGERAIV